MLRLPASEGGAGDQEQRVHALQAGGEGLGPVVVEGPDGDAAAGEVRDRVRTADQRDDVARGDAEREQMGDDQAAQVAGGAGDGEGHDFSFKLLTSD